MMLFLIFLIPLCLAVIVLNYSRDGNGIILPWRPFFLGLALFFPSILLYLSVIGLFEPTYTTAGFFFYTLLKEHLLLLVFGLGWAVLFRHWLFMTMKENTFFKTLAFFGGYYSAINVFQYLARITHLDLYAVMLLPLLNLAVALGAAVFLSSFINSYGLPKYLSAAGGGALPFLLTIPSVLYLRHTPAWALIITLLLTAGIGFLFYLRKEDLH